MTIAKENLLAGKVAIITGASEGLGFEIARQFILQGASLCICSRDKRKISLAESELKKWLENHSLYSAWLLMYQTIIGVMNLLRTLSIDIKGLIF